MFGSKLNRQHTLNPSRLPGLRCRSRNLVLKCNSQRGRLRLRQIVQDKSSLYRRAGADVLLRTLNGFESRLHGLDPGLCYRPG